MLRGVGRVGFVLKCASCYFDIFDGFSFSPSYENVKFSGCAFYQFIFRTKLK